MLRSKLAKLIISSGSAQALLFIGSILTAALYSPQSIGEYGFYVTLASLLSIAAALRLDYYAFFTSKEEAARTLAPTCGAAFIAASIISLIALSFFGGASSETIIYLAISIISFSTFHLLSQHTLLQKDYDSYSKGRLIHGASFIALLIATHKLETFGLLLSYCAAQASSSLFLYIKNPFKIDTKNLSTSFTYRLKDRLTNLASTSIQLLSPALPLLAGAFFFSREDLGVFFWLSQMFAGGAAIIKRSLMGYLSAELIHNGKIQIETLNTARKSLNLGIVLSLTFAILAWSFSRLPVDLGQDWSKAMALVPPLVLLYVTDALLQPLGSLLPSIDKEKLHLINETFRLLAVLTCFIATSILDSGITGFTWTYASAMTLFYVTGALLFCKIATLKEIAQHG